MAMDPAAAVVQLLSHDLMVQGLAHRGVYAGELPRFEDGRTPPDGAVCVMPAGGNSLGPGARSWVPWTVTRMDILCFAVDMEQSARLHRAVNDKLRFLAHIRIGDIIIRDCILSGGPITIRDPDTRWPYTQGVYDISTTP